MPAPIAPKADDRDAVGIWAQIDDDVREAVEDVDRSNLQWHLGLSIRERLRACLRTTSMLTRLRRDPSASR